MKLADYARKQGISYRTAWRWYKDGKLNAQKLPGGTIVVYDGQPAGKNKYLVEIEPEVWERIAWLPISLNDFLKDCLPTTAVDNVLPATDTPANPSLPSSFS